MAKIILKHDKQLTATQKKYGRPRLRALSRINSSLVQEVFLDNDMSIDDVRTLTGLTETEIIGPHVTPGKADKIAMQFFKIKAVPKSDWKYIGSNDFFYEGIGAGCGMVLTEWNFVRREAKE